LEPRSSHNENPEKISNLYSSCEELKQKRYFKKS
jgi:hypothetical protein